MKIAKELYNLLKEKDSFVLCNDGFGNYMLEGFNSISDAVAFKNEHSDGMSEINAVSVLVRLT